MTVKAIVLLSLALLVVPGTAFADVNRIRGELETVHLAAHLATARVLTRDQIAHYNKMRGY